MIFHNKFSFIIDFKSKSDSPNQLTRRTAATLPPGGQRFFFFHLTSSHESFLYSISYLMI
ncbi:hypothetical protein BFAG_02483 [Bacteroides fragilis 3_1_12]|uniref:Uncharacterized protein n=1 Tax=Bacteroides fragilis 3_1_12 TaxID=457424 RepID=A0ABN0BLN0_BACFG|nr:hypothetical protein BFAG_02483 [Bacteroides fragilis 3_1_12]